MEAGGVQEDQDSLGRTSDYGKNEKGGVSDFSHPGLGWNIWVTLWPEFFCTKVGSGGTGKLQTTWL